MSIDAAVKVYKNIPRLLVSRHIQSSYTFLNDSDASSALSTYNYIAIEGTRTKVTGETLSAVIIITTPSSAAGRSAAGFRDMFSNTIKDPSVKLEITIISDIDVTQNIQKIIQDEIRQKYPDIFIETHDYNKFKIVYIDSPFVPYHEIVHPDKERELLKFYYQRKENLPKMLLNDTAVVWIGAHPGDVVMVNSISENCGIMQQYYLVINKIL